MTIIFLGLVIGAIAATVFSLAISFFPEYMLISQIASCIAVLFLVGIMMCTMMLQPVLPYLEAKLKNGMLLVITQINDNVIMVVPQKKATTLDTGDSFGSFIGSPNAVKSFAGFRKEEDVLREYAERESLTDKIDPNAKIKSLGGVKTYMVYEENAVPAETGLISLCTRMDAANISNIEEILDEENKDRIVLKDLDLSVITKYFNYVNPHYLNVRVERTAAKLAKRYQQSWQTLLPWISMMTMFILFAAVAYAIIMSAMPSTGVQTLPTIIP